MLLRLRFGVWPGFAVRKPEGLREYEWLGGSVALGSESGLVGLVLTTEPPKPLPAVAMDALLLDMRLSERLTTRSR